MKFPFRWGPDGRVGISTCTPTDVSHIDESIQQILFTRYRERFFNAAFGSPLQSLVFENITEFAGILANQLIDVLTTQEKRITIQTLNVIPNPVNDSVTVFLAYSVNIFNPPVNAQTTLVMGS